MTVSRAEDEGLLGVSLALDLGFSGLGFSICQKGEVGLADGRGPRRTEICDHNTGFQSFSPCQSLRVFLREVFWGERKVGRLVGWLPWWQKAWQCRES